MTLKDLLSVIKEDEYVQIIIIGIVDSSFCWAFFDRAGGALEILKDYYAKKVIKVRTGISDDGKPYFRIDLQDDK